MSGRDKHSPYQGLCEGITSLYSQPKSSIMPTCDIIIREKYQSLILKKTWQLNETRCLNSVLFIIRICLKKTKNMSLYCVFLCLELQIIAFIL